LPNAPAPQKPPEPKEFELISEPQRKRMYAIAKSVGYSDDEFRQFVEGWGFESSKQVTKGKYTQMCDALQGDVAAPRGASSSSGGTA
jgi:hypothetical protein